jgi:small subunit ribosomal protein S6
MAEKRTYNYEAMFLLGQAQAADFSAAIAHVRQLVEKHGAVIYGMRKWDERRLAYEIKKQKRGIFILCFFSAPAERMGEIERACNLSEGIIRVLITRADHLTVDEMKAADDAKGLEAEAKLRASQPALAAAGLSEPTPVPTVSDELIDEEL